LPEASARIVSVAHHDSGVRRVALTLGSPFPFLAGQYLNVVHPGGVRIPMSIASAPDRLPQLELHYRPLPGAPEAALMNELLDGSQDLSIEGPHGDVRFDGPYDDDLLLIAGGSGISQCRAIIEHLRERKQTCRVRLIWSVTQSDQLYCDAELRAFARWLEYVPLVDAPDSENAAIVWLRTAELPQSGRIVVSGGPGFVHSVADVLRAIGVGCAAIESDVFSYAPR
jgi:CDP-4-dehydro-6-deoxyglucose reductase, E3